MLRILQARLQQYVNWELARFTKGWGSRDQIANIWWIIEKAKGSQKRSNFVDYTKTFDCIDHNKLWKIFKKKVITNCLACLLRNLYAGLEATGVSRHGTTKVVQNWEWSTSRFYMVTLLIQLLRRAHYVKCQARWSTRWNWVCREKYQ